MRIDGLNRMANVVVFSVLTVVLLATAVHAGPINSGWYVAFMDPFYGEPTGNADQGLLDKGWTFGGSYNFIKRSGAPYEEVWMECTSGGTATLTSPKVSFVNGTEYRVEDYGTNANLQWAPHLALTDGAGNGFMFYFRRNDKKMAVFAQYSGQSDVWLGDYNTASYSPDFSFVLTSTTLDLYAEGAAVDLNFGAAGTSYVHSFSQSIAESGFSLQLKASPYNGAAVMKYATEVAILTPQKVYLNCDQVWEDGKGLNADINRDCEVNFDDFVELAQQWLLCNDPQPSNCL